MAEAGPSYSFQQRVEAAHTESDDEDFGLADLIPVCLVLDYRNDVTVMAELTMHPKESPYSSAYT